VKRLLLVLAVALLAGGAACGLYYHHRVAPVQAEDEMHWLRREFRLTDAQIAEIQRMDRAYRPICDGHCKDYMEAHDRLMAMLAHSRTWTPDMSQTMERLYRVEMECHRDMLKHAFEVSTVMAPEEARRYLAMIESRVALAPPAEMIQNTR
jgi:hypothetical protein